MTFQDQDSIAKSIEAINGDMDALWITLAAILVFFMQAGFTFVELGFTRSKNSGNIIMKNLMDFTIGAIMFWALGYGIMFGSDLVAGGLFSFIPSVTYYFFFHENDLYKLLLPA